VPSGPKLDEPRAYALTDARGQLERLRARWLVLAAIVAITLGFFSIFTVRLSPLSIAFRHHTHWESTTTLLIAQPGLPEIGPGPTWPVMREVSLSQIYARLADSPAIGALARRHGPLNGTYRAVPTEFAPPHGTPVPLLRIEATSRTATQAANIARRVTDALRTYITQQQTAAGIPNVERFALLTAKRPGPATRVGDRHLRAPLITVAAILTLLAAAAFSNIRAPRNQAP
jgi:hypothetical protein